MGTVLRSLVLWLFVINLGIAFGAGLYESRVVAPSWLEIPPASWPNTGLLFWVYVTTVPLTLLTLASFVAALTEHGPRRKWWFIAAFVVLLERVATFTYFIPTMLSLTSADFPPAEVRSSLMQWMALNHVRHLLTLCGWLAALRALSFEPAVPTQGVHSKLPASPADDTA